MKSNVAFACGPLDAQVFCKHPQSLPTRSLDHTISNFKQFLRLGAGQLLLQQAFALIDTEASSDTLSLGGVVG